MPKKQLSYEKCFVLQLVDLKVHMDKLEEVMNSRISNLSSTYLHINEGSQALMDNKKIGIFFTIYAILALCGFSEETKNA